MALARLVVIEGPDAGVEFPIPVRGGGIGRGDENVVQLSDLAVSRAHCALELRDGRLALVEAGSRNKTLVNGKPIDVHFLAAGDEIFIGQTRMAFVPAEDVPIRDVRPSRVTIEVGSGELMRAARDRIAGPDGRAQRHLAALARLGDALRTAGDATAVGRAACEVAVDALAADRAFLLTNDVGNRMLPIGSAIAGDDPDGASYAVPPDAMQKVLAERKAIALEPTTAQGRRAVCAPLTLVEGEPPLGLLLVDRRPGHAAPAWDQVDLMACGCVAHLITAALAGVEARQALASENRQLQERLGGGSQFVGQSAPARGVLEFVSKVGPSDATVLLGGESGSGKEMVARAIHNASRRSHGAFIAVNCAALTETLLESELFGHEKGAFSGAGTAKPGLLETADGGTVFFDEVASLSPASQAKLLRVIETKKFTRVGDVRERTSDVRIVAAANQDLRAEVQAGRFREDLYFRLSAATVWLPPLRDRRTEISILSARFLGDACARAKRDTLGLSEDAMRALSAHDWPGNVRELKNAMDYLAATVPGKVVDAWHVEQRIGATAEPAATGDAEAAPEPGEAPSQFRPIKDELADLERQRMVEALTAADGNQTKAAQLIHMPLRTFVARLKKYDIR